MASTTSRSVTPDTLGAWLIKARPDAPGFGELVASGFRSITHRCVRPGYRAGLVRPGQPVLLWISGRHPDLPAGIHAQGRTTGLPRRSDAVTLDLPVALHRLERPVPRPDLLAHPTLCRLEVLRMPAGSNPSFLSPAELQDLREQWPQVTVG